ELKLYVRARDNNVERGGTPPPDVGPFTFLIVSQVDLDDLMMAQKVPLQNLLRKAIEKLETSRGVLTSQALALKDPREAAGTAQRLDQALVAVREAGDVSRGILTECQEIVEEMRLNQFDPERIGEENEKIVFPLVSVCDSTTPGRFSPDVVSKAGVALAL